MAENRLRSRSFEIQDETSVGRRPNSDSSSVNMILVVNKITDQTHGYSLGVR
jgi:hypothetical protein